jgi:hypothetical protein
MNLFDLWKIKKISNKEGNAEFDHTFSNEQSQELSGDVEIQTPYPHGDIED